MGNFVIVVTKYVPPQVSLCTKYNCNYREPWIPNAVFPFFMYNLFLTLRDLTFSFLKQNAWIPPPFPPREWGRVCVPQLERQRERPNQHTARRHLDPKRRLNITGQIMRSPWDTMCSLCVVQWSSAQPVQWPVHNMSPDVRELFWHYAEHVQLNVMCSVLCTVCVGREEREREITFQPLHTDIKFTCPCSEGRERERGEISKETLKAPPSPPPPPPPMPVSLLSLSLSLSLKRRALSLHTACF